MGCNEEYLKAIGELTKQFEVPSMGRVNLNKDITLWVDSFLKPDDIKDIRVLIESDGKFFW